jgi:hypothetical protein
VDDLIEFLDIVIDFLYAATAFDTLRSAGKTPDNIPYNNVRRSQKKQNKHSVKNRIITNIDHISTSLYLHYSKEKTKVKIEVAK